MSTSTDWDDWAQRTIPVPMVVGHEFVGEVVGRRVERQRLPAPATSSAARATSSAAAAATAWPAAVTSARTRSGSASSEPGAFAEYVALPMTNVWHHWPGVERGRRLDLRPLRERRAHGARVPGARRGRARHRAPARSAAWPSRSCATRARGTSSSTDLNPYRLDLARRMGATLAVDPRERDLDDVQRELGMTEGFDVGLEMSGNAEALRSGVANMAHGGRIAILGIPTGASRDRPRPRDLQHADDQGHLRPRDVRDLVPDERDARVRSRHLAGDHAPILVLAISRRPSRSPARASPARCILDWKGHR